jgi:hypothetical protein
MICFSLIYLPNSVYGIADSRGRLVAGSFQGYTDHVDGKPSDARFNHPKGIAMDDKGNVYVADTQNLAIRKIGDAGMCEFSNKNSGFI